MFRSVVIMSVLARCLDAANSVLPVRHQERVVGGSDASISDYPYQLSYELHGLQLCGASILNIYWAVTAAHCADGMSPGDVTLRSGTTFRKTGGSVHPVSKLIVHPNYNPDTVRSDLALVQVVTKFAMGRNVQPIPITWFPSKVGDSVTITGWGYVHPTKEIKSAVLQMIKMPIVSAEACRQAHLDGNLTTGDKFCAGPHVDGYGSCRSDSGGPAVSNGVLIGIVSFGSNRCGVGSVPGAFTAVLKYRRWLLRTTAL